MITTERSNCDYDCDYDYEITEQHKIGEAKKGRRGAGSKNSIRGRHERGVREIKGEMEVSGSKKK